MRIYRVLLLAGMLLILPAVLFGGPAARSKGRVTLDRFVLLVSDAYSRDDKAGIIELAGANRDLLRGALDRLLMEYVRDPGGPRSVRAKEIMGQASSLAEAAGKVSADHYLSKKVAAYRGWNKEERAANIRGREHLMRGAREFAQGAYVKALQSGEAAAEMFRSIGDFDGEMDALHLAGQSARKLTRYPVALKYHERALELAKEYEDRLHTGMALIDLGDVYERKKTHKRAIELYKEGLEALKVPGDWREAVRGLRQLGDIYVDSGRFDDAFRVYGQALSYAKQGGDAAAVALQRDYMGYFYRRLGDYAKAVELHGQALAAAQDISDLQERLRAQARAFNHLGLSVGAIADTGKIRDDGPLALAHLKRAIHYEEKALGAALESKDMWRQGYVIRALAYLHRQEALLREGGEREEALRRSLKYAQDAHARAIYMGEKEWQGLALHHLALARAALGQSADAKKSFEDALAIWESIGDLRAQGFAHRFMAEVLYEPAGRYREALAAHDKAIRAFQPVQSLEQIADVHLKKGLLYERIGELQNAKDAYLASIQTLEAIRDRLATEEHKVVFFERRQNPYEALISLLIRLYRRDSQTKDAVLALEVSERARGRTILDMIKGARTKILAGVDQGMLSREQEIHSLVYRIRSELIGQRDPASALALKERLNQLDFEYAQLLRELDKRYPNYARLKSPRPLSLKEIQQRVLRPGEVLLEYFVALEETYLFVVSRTKLEAVLTLPVGKSELTRQVEALRRPFKRIKETRNVDALASFNLGLAHELYARLFRPCEPFISAASKLVIVPHGPLLYLPFELLVISEMDEGRQDRGKRINAARYLVEQAPAISYAISASTMDPRLHRGQPGELSGLLLAFGNPTGREETSPKHKVRLKGGEFEMTPLPYSEVEVQNVAALYAPNARIYLRHDATKDRFLKESGRYSSLHLSTHGILNEEHPMFSALVFAPGRQGKDFKLLKTHEIFNLSLNAELVTLSACEVGLGEIKDGEGLLGLSRAFLYAGVEGLVVSMWSVDDRATATLITDFHRMVRKDPGRKAEALRQGKLNLLGAGRAQKRGPISYAHPFFWAPFILVEGARP